MSRITFLLALTMGIGSPAMAAKHVSVMELEQLLFRAHGESDGKVAQELSDVELTERASSIRLARWETEFPGRRCREALTVMADASEFLDLPAADISTDAPPDVAAQKAMLQMKTTITRLPNFFATRKTERFEDTPPHQTIEHFDPSSSGRIKGLEGMPNGTKGESAYQPMHGAGKSSDSVSFRDGHEITGSKQADTELEDRPVLALTTYGEFGPILIIVLEDAVKSKITWGYWEQGANGTIAVFRYSVPQGQSSYLVGVPHGLKIDKTFPAYHGEIAIDPANGDILRITVISDFAPPNEMVRSSILVEYGAVQIGGTSYICPVRGLAFAKMPVGESHGAATTLKTELNDVAFTGYHLFRAEARIVPATGPGDELPAPPK